MPHPTDLPSVERDRAGEPRCSVAVSSDMADGRYRALMIGGNGKWASRTYRPVFDNNPDWQLTVADPVSAEAPTRFIKLGGDFARDRAILDAADRDRDFDLVIISTPPETYHQYLEWALAEGADIVCDKPVIALPCQFGSAEAPRRLSEQYAQLRWLSETTPHRRYRALRCHVYIPMKRRQDWPFGDILTWLDEVHSATATGSTFFNLVFNDGAYRFPDEYDRPGAGDHAGRRDRCDNAIHDSDAIGAELRRDIDLPPQRLFPQAEPLLCD